MLMISSNQNCSVYGPLDFGVIAWGLDFDYKPISGSTINSVDGPDTIQKFNWIYNNFNYTMDIIFNPKRIKCHDVISDVNKLNKTYQNCSTYGILYYGAVSWGLDSKYNAIPGSTTNGMDGLDTINAFNTIFSKFNNTIFIVFQAKQPYCL